MPSFWDDAIESPAFNLGIGLLAGAPTATPWQAAAQQFNQYQALRQNREYQKLHAKLYAAQARKAEEEGQARQARQQMLAQVRATISDPRELQLFDIDPETYAKSKLETRLKPIVVGRALIDPSNPEKPLYRDPEAPPAPSELQKILHDLRDPNIPASEKNALLRRLQVLQTPPGTNVRIENYPQPMPAINPQTGQVELTQFGTQGTPRPTGFAPAPQPVVTKEPTFEEKKAAGFLSRMQRAEEILADPSLQAAQVTPLGEAAIRGLPLTGGKLAPYAMETARQKVRQAQMDWVRAKLRPESGASIPDKEMEDEISTYFPQPGETNPAIIKQKQQARMQAVEQIRSMAGRAPVPGNVDVAAGTTGRTIVRRVRLKNGKTGIEYSDGTRSVE